MKLEIDITNIDLEQILTDIALTNKLTVQQYANNIITNFLEAQLRGKYADLIVNDTLAGLKLKLGSYQEIKPK